MRIERFVGHMPRHLRRHRHLYFAVALLVAYILLGALGVMGFQGGLTSASLRPDFIWAYSNSTYYAVEIVSTGMRKAFSRFSFFLFALELGQFLFCGLLCTNFAGMAVGYGDLTSKEFSTDVFTLLYVSILRPLFLTFCYSYYRRFVDVVWLILQYSYSVEDLW